MTKSVKNLTERELEPQFQAVLRELIGRVPFLKLESFETDVLLPPHAGRSGDRADWVVKLKAGDRSWTLVAEAKKNGQPREVRMAVLQLKHHLSLLREGTLSHGIFVAPFISEESAALCVEADVSYADLAGNARLCFDQVFIQTRVAENPFHEKRALKSLFSKKAARVLRVLLQGPLRAWKVKDLAAAAKVSLGHASAVRQQLLAQEWAVDDSDKAAGASHGIRITKPDDLLDAWAVADRWEDRTETREYSLLLTDPMEIALSLHQLLADKPHAFTQWMAAALRHPHSSTPVTTVYVEEFPDEAVLKKALLARRVDSGGRLRVVLPQDEGVMNPLQTAHGLPLVSDVQLYLDLLRAGLRGEEAASELRQWPDFSGGWT